MPAIAMRSRPLIAALLALLATSPAWAAPAPGNPQLIAIPEPLSGAVMRTEVYRPAGPGPFPLAIVNHGTDESADLRARQELPEVPLLVSWLLRRGYVVALPQRPGHGASGGAYRERAGTCDRADFEIAGFATADAIEAAMTHLLRQSFVAKRGVVVIGHSAGGWGALALASRRPAALRAVVSFAGGRGGRSYGYANRNCSPERLVAAARRFGESTRVPTLWIYAENDSFFPPPLSQALAEAFRSGGGRAEYHRLPVVGAEGHYVMQLDEAAPLWQPILTQFPSRSLDRTAGPL
jgi:dienelactone hydrolase